MDPVCHAIARTHDADLVIISSWAMLDMGLRCFYAEGHPPLNEAELLQRTSPHILPGQRRIVLVQTDGAGHFLGTMPSDNQRMLMSPVGGDQPTGAEAATVEKDARLKAKPLLAGPSAPTAPASPLLGRGLRNRKSRTVLDAAITKGSQKQVTKQAASLAGSAGPSSDLESAPLRNFCWNGSVGPPLDWESDDLKRRAFSRISSLKSRLPPTKAR